MKSQFFITLILWFGVGHCQDIDVQPLYSETPIISTTVGIDSTTAYTTENVDTTSTTEESTPVTTTTTPISTETAQVSTETTTTENVISTSTTAESTTESSTSTSSSMESTTENSPSVPSTAGPVTTSRPTIAQPLQNCYYRQQQSIPQFYWTCEGPKWYYSLICFQCCQFEGAAFAGCSQVHFSNCEKDSQLNPAVNS